MSIFKRFIQWLDSFFAPRAPQRQQTQQTPRSTTTLPIHFPGVVQVEQPPKGADVRHQTLYFVVSNQRPKWVLFQCPCQCGEVITLSLQAAHRPRWSLQVNALQRPTLHPSVWRDRGCNSHFWVRDGQILWCEDTGTSPFISGGYRS